MNNQRHFRQGRTASEKEAYKRFLRTSTFSESTEEPKEDSNRTNFSSVNERKKEKDSKKERKSILLKVRDNVWVVSIVTTMVASLIIGCVKLLADRANIYFEINSIQKDIDNLSKKYDEVNTLDKKFSVMEVEFKKDLELIKERLNWIKK